MISPAARDYYLAVTPSGGLIPGNARREDPPKRNYLVPPGEVVDGEVEIFALPAHTVFKGGGDHRWPCRLLSVRPAGPAITPEWGLTRSIMVPAAQVVEELPAHAVFGPCGEKIVQILQAAENLTLRQMQALNRLSVAPAEDEIDPRPVFRWQCGPKRVQEQQTMRESAQLMGSMLAAHRDEVAANAQGLARYEAGRSVDRWADRSGCGMPGEVRILVSVLIGDAAAAIAARHLLSAQDFALMWGPWAEVTGDTA